MPTEPRAASLPGGWMLQAGPFAILAATAAYLQSHWSQIPERFPVHWGIDGRPNGWSSHTLMGVYGPLLPGLVILTIVAVITNLTLRRAAAGETSAENVAARLKRDAARDLGLFLAGLEYFLAATFSLVALLPLTGAPNVRWVLLAAGSIVCAFVIFAVKLSREQQSRHALLAAAAPHSTAGAGNAGEQCWKAGMFYYNPGDPAVWVEKRSGLGYTLNFAHAFSWVLLAALLLLPLGTALFAMWHR